MTELTANRTLVKSPPELWAECSDAASLARHLAQFGEIRITRLEPENAIAWEGERASGTVRLEPSGWGTKVVLTACVGPPAVEVQAPEPAPEPAPAPGPAPRELRRRGLLARLVAWWRGPVEPDSVVVEPPEPVAVEPPEPAEDPPAEDPPAEDPAVPGAEAALTAALESLGQAHHRPFSRA